MKFLVEREALKDALHVVVGRTKSAHLTIPILTHVLIEAEGQSVKLIGHDLDSCSQTSIKAEGTTPGAVAMPADRFHKLVSGLGEGTQVAIESENLTAKVRAGRSTYQFQLMDPRDFPEALEPKNPATIKLTAKQVARLFKTPDCSILTGNDRMYLKGIYLHEKDKRLAGCATNGHTLVRAFTDVKPPKFTGIIVPDKACSEIVRLVGQAEEASLEIGETLIAVEVNNRRFVSKLIDGTFPDYERVIPSATAPVIAVEGPTVDAALARLVAAHDPDKSPTVRFQWESGDLEAVKASLSTTFGIGEEQIECDGRRPEPGEVIMQVDYVRTIIDALGGNRIRLFIDGPGDPVRVENPDDTDIVAVIMPCRA